MLQRTVYTETRDSYCEVQLFSWDSLRQKQTKSELCSEIDDIIDQ